MKREYIGLGIIIVLAIVIFVTYRVTSPFVAAEIRTLGYSNDIYWVNYDASRRGAFIWINKKIHEVNPNVSVMKFCSEPTPDTSFNIETLLSMENKNKKATAELNQNTTILPGRTSGVLALRETLYRLCELSVNKPEISSEIMISMYKDVIANITLYAQSESNLNKAEAGRIIASSPSYDITLAKKSEKDGFEAIVDRKYEKAEEYFSKAEKYFPTLHNNFEIYSALNDRDIGDINTVENEFLNKKEQEFLNDVIKKWSWGADADQIAKIKKLLTDKSKK